MLTGTKKNPPNGQNWFVVLNPLKSELERSRVAREIARAFRIPVDEAMDLVGNTPIILLDNLLYATALQVKQYFQSSHEDILVSNDNLVKRRCYRTVWPTPPNLVFLHQLKSPEQLPSENKTEKLDHNEAIQEIRSWGQTGAVSADHGERGPAGNGITNHHHRHFRGMLEEERETLLKENVGLKEHLAQLRKALEKTQTDAVQNEKIVQVSEAAKTQKEKEAQELQALLSHAEEKYELLREEFRQTRQYFDEKLGFYDRQSEEFLKKIEERELMQKELLQEKQALSKSFQAAKSDCQRAKEELDQLRREGEGQAGQFRRELENQKTLTEGLQAKIRNLDEGRKIAQASETRLMQELELQTEQAKRWEQRSSELEKEIRRFRASFEEKQKAWQVRVAELEAREMDLENARQQIRELHVELDQREAAQRKKTLHEQLVAKESRLKQIVKEQEKLESEIRDREEFMSRLLAEQESVEREVIESKQAHRHLTEKLKREPTAEERKPQASPVRPEAVDD